MNSTTELLKTGRPNIKLLFSHQYSESHAVQHIFYQRLTEAMCISCQTLYGIMLQKESLVRLSVSLYNHATTH